MASLYSRGMATRTRMICAAPRPRSPRGPRGFSLVEVAVVATVVAIVAAVSVPSIAGMSATAKRHQETALARQKVERARMEALSRKELQLVKLDSTGIHIGHSTDCINFVQAPEVLPLNNLQVVMSSSACFNPSGESTSTTVTTLQLDPQATISVFPAGTMGFSGEMFKDARREGAANAQVSLQAISGATAKQMN